MKHYLTLALLFLFAIAKAQNTDSLKIKLDHVKQLFIDGTITQQEYQALRGKILGLNPTQPTPQPIVIQQVPKPLPNLDSIQIERLRQNGNANIGGGTFLVVLSTGLWIGGVVVAANHPPGASLNPLEVVLPLFSVVTFIPGVCLLVQGARQKHRYYQYRPRELAINIKPDKIGLAYKF